MPLTSQQAVNNILIIRDHYGRLQAGDNNTQRMLDHDSQVDEFQQQIEDIKEKFYEAHGGRTRDELSRKEKKELDKQIERQTQALEKLEKDKLKPQVSTIRHQARLDVLNTLALEVINVPRIEILPRELVEAKQAQRESGQVLSDSEAKEQVLKKRLIQALIWAIREIAGSSFGGGSKTVGSLREVLNELLAGVPGVTPIDCTPNLSLGLRRDKDGTFQYDNIHIVNRAKEILGEYAKTMDRRNSHVQFWNLKTTSTAKMTAFENIMGEFNDVFDEVATANGVVGYDVHAELLNMIRKHTGKQWAHTEDINEGKFKKRLEQLRGFLREITPLKNVPTREQWLDDQLAAARGATNPIAPAPVQAPARVDAATTAAMVEAIETAAVTAVRDAVASAAAESGIVDVDTAVERAVEAIEAAVVMGPDAVLAVNHAINVVIGREFPASTVYEAPTKTPVNTTTMLSPSSSP